jgi:hypothetical protein
MCIDKQCKNVPLVKMNVSEVKLNVPAEKAEVQRAVD